MPDFAPFSELADESKRPRRSFCRGNYANQPKGGAKNTDPNRHSLDIDATVSSSACHMQAWRRESTLSRIDVFVPCYRYGRFLYQCVNNLLGVPQPMSTKGSL
jgi:hypothetical protein